MKFQYRSGLFFLIIFIYIISSFGWWWYIMQKNNRTNFQSLIAKEQVDYIFKGGTADQFLQTELYNQIHTDYLRNQYMLLGEGIVFITLISIGFIRIRNTFRDEIRITRQQNNFLLSITHELKSPLASLKLSMQTLRKHKLDPERVQRLAHISLDDIDRLESLVENILLASKMDNSKFVLDTDAINISELVKQITRRFADKYTGERNFDLQIEDDIYINGDRLSITSVFHNLLENAYKYSGNADQISVRLSADDNKCTCMISDTGIGIADKEKPKIFERFYRIGREETRSTKGTGLGLFIVKQVIQLHNGTIHVLDNKPKGSIFEITLPLVS